jgi:N4-(beta-N-acetylglucosaminyl)-L-asparaginase
VCRLVLDSSGRLAASCTTSGLAFKLPGRVGDSPVIGAGIFVDGDVGAAVCTGLGEVPLRTMAAFLAVEFMRAGALPQQACEAAVQRMLKDPATSAETCQVGIIALSRGGVHGAFAIRDGFTYALGSPESNGMLKSAFAVKPSEASVLHCD